MLRFRQDSHFRFIFAGGGARRAALETFCRDHSITNVFFGSYCDRSDLGVRLGQGHIGLVTQLPESLGSIVPSKTYGIMAAGRPILFIGPAASTPARIVARHQCGWHFEPGDVAGCTRLLTELSVHPERMWEAGSRARKAFEEHYDQPMAVARVASVLGLDPCAVAHSSTKRLRNPFRRQTASAIGH